MEQEQEILATMSESVVGTTEDLPALEVLVYEEIGLAGLLLIVAVGWLVSQLYLASRDLKNERKAHEKTVEKLHNLGLATVEVTTNVSNTLEKIYGLLTSKPTKKD